MLPAGEGWVRGCSGRVTNDRQRVQRSTLTGGTQCSVRPEPTRAYVRVAAFEEHAWEGGLDAEQVRVVGPTLVNPSGDPQRFRAVVRRDGDAKLRERSLTVAETAAVVER